MSKQLQLLAEKKIPRKIDQVYKLLKEKPQLRSLKFTNSLVIEFWKKYDGFLYDTYDPNKCTSHETISRAARKIRAIGVLDTEGNIKSRGYLEQAYRNSFK